MAATGGGSWRRSSVAGGRATSSRCPAGHLFSIYDGCREEGIELVDVRHEQSAAFAAEGFAKATRRSASRR